MPGPSLTRTSRRTADISRRSRSPSTDIATQVWHHATFSHLSSALGLAQ